MKLTASEQGTLNGLFEVQFGVKLQPGFNITLEQCGDWTKERRNRTDSEFFERKFKVPLPEGVHLTTDVCNAWADKVTYFLLGCELKRYEAKTLRYRRN